MGESFNAELIGLVVMAVLAFWSVGAYNRLVRLRNAAASAWRMVDELLLERVRLLEQFTLPLRESRPELRAVVEAALAAANQTTAACDAARERPLVARHLHGVSMALQVLQSSMAALPMQIAAAAPAEADPPGAAAPAESAPGDISPADASAAEPAAELAAAPDAHTEETPQAESPDSEPAAPADDLPFEAWAAQAARLEFAARQFNAAVQTYNDAALQIPTRVVSTLFGLRPARTLDIARRDGFAG